MRRRPYRVVVGDEEIITFAGLWDRWSDGEEEISSCTIITTTPNQMMSELHDRMPVILDEDSRDKWLDPSIQDKGMLQSLLKPFQGEMNVYEVSKEVNNPRNHSADLLKSI